MWWGLVGLAFLHPRGRVGRRSGQYGGCYTLRSHFQTADQAQPDDQACTAQREEGRHWRW